jgi:SPP1 gp7 family putative phage head morphogenesis protein
MRPTVHDLFRLRSRAHRLGRAKLAARIPEQPRAQELAYVAALIGVMRKVHELVERHIFPTLADFAIDVPRQDAARQDVLFGRVANQFRLIGEKVGEYTDDDELIPVVDQVAVKVNKFNRGEMGKVLGVDFTPDTAIQGMLTGFRRENVNLIQTIARSELKRVQNTLAEAQVQGLRVETIRDQLLEGFDVTDARAALIARDQTLKLNADLSMKRQQDVGVQEYQWSTSHDERVRPGHANLDGTRHGYLSPPVVDQKTGRREHPGKDFQCRCVAVPYIPGIDDKS